MMTNAKPKQFNIVTV